MMWFYNLETLSGKESLIIKEEKLDIKPPSSPEDGEITDDDEDKIADEKFCLNAIKVEVTLMNCNFKCIVLNLYLLTVMHSILRFVPLNLETESFEFFFIKALNKQLICYFMFYYFL